MKYRVELTEKDLRELILGHIRNGIGLEVDEKDVVIEVKSKQNYRSEWEPAAFRAVVERGGP